MYPEAILKALTGIPSAPIALLLPNEHSALYACSFATGANSNVTKGNSFFCVVSMEVVETLDVVAT